MIKNFSYKKVLLAYGVAFFVLAVVQLFIISNAHVISWTDAVKDSILTNVLLALAAFGMVNVLRVYNPKIIAVLIYCVGVAFLIIAGYQQLIPYVFPDNINYVNFFNATFYLRAVFAWLVILVIASDTYLWSFLQDQKQMEERRLTNEKLVREAELERLKLQLQPHFLFNSLNSISALVGSKPEMAREMILQLSSFLRGTIKQDDSQFIYFEHELEHLQLYLEIEKVRFGHRLKTELQVSDESLKCKLPSLLIQPIVENAIKFGLYDTIGEITIRLNADVKDSHLIITVENPFDPQTSKPRQGTGFGLSSIQRRLYLLFARQDLLTTNQQESVFRTTVKIPQAL